MTRLRKRGEEVDKVFSGEMGIGDLLAGITPTDPDELYAALEPFARMFREGTNPSELACVRGTASDMTVITSGDFMRAWNLMPEYWKREHLEEYSLSSREKRRDTTGK